MHVLIGQICDRIAPGFVADQAVIDGCIYLSGSTVFQLTLTDIPCSLIRLHSLLFCHMLVCFLPTVTHDFISLIAI